MHTVDLPAITPSPVPARVSHELERQHVFPHSQNDLTSLPHPRSNDPCNQRFVSVDDYRTLRPGSRVTAGSCATVERGRAYAATSSLTSPGTLHGAIALPGFTTGADHLACYRAAHATAEPFSHARATTKLAAASAQSCTKPAFRAARVTYGQR